jgi:hypothetical protein
MTKASGMVYRKGNKERISFATIKFYKGASTLYTTTNDCGFFTIDIPEPGIWTIVALEKDSHASSPLQYEMSQDHSDIMISLDRIAETVDDHSGRIFFWVILGILILLIILYTIAHLFIFNVGQGFNFWFADSSLYLEILLWGLAGILVSKIFTISWYLRWHRFYREGILMHIAHIVATPLLVLVTILLLSQITLTFKLANSNEVSIDLSKPSITIAFAFIIGTSPWLLWNFILDTAKHFFDNKST